MLTVRELWRYPVKSMQGERLDDSDLTPIGLPGDRAFGVQDLETGMVLTARREPRLLFARARWRDGEVEVRGPDRERLDSDQALSNWLGRPISLIRAGAKGALCENPQNAEREADWTTWQGPGHAWHDSPLARVSLLTVGTIGAWPPARFRANVLLDGAGEDALVGRTIKLGMAILDVPMAISRCVMVTRAQPGIEVDREVLRTIRQSRSGNLAVGALVVEPGRVAVGDELTP